MMFVGTKVVQAEPMSRLAYNLLRGWTVPADENPQDPGYIVEYMDGGPPNVPGREGYVSWSPKEVFEQSYQFNGALGFGQALELMRRGYAIARAGWNGKGLFVYLVPANAYPATTGVARAFFNEKPVPYNAYMAIKGADGRVSTWAPSGNDVLADDWHVLNVPALIDLAHELSK